MTRKKEFPGFMERVNILGKYLSGKPLTGLWEKAREFKCNPDDLMDAACLAVTASLAAHSLCESIPEEPEQDERGLCMKLTVLKRNVGAPADGKKVAASL